MSSDSINYAAYVGIHSVAAAAVFAAVYVPLTGLFVFRAFKNPIRACFMMVLFCVGERSLDLSC